MNTKSIFQPTLFETDLEEQAIVNQVNELEDFVNIDEGNYLY